MAYEHTCLVSRLLRSAWPFSLDSFTTLGVAALSATSSLQCHWRVSRQQRSSWPNMQSQAA